MTQYKSNLFANFAGSGVASLLQLAFIRGQFKNGPGIRSRSCFEIRHGRPLNLSYQLIQNRRMILGADFAL